MLLFQLLRCFTNRHVPQYQFMKDFLDKIVATVSTTEEEIRCVFDDN